MATCIALSMLPFLVLLGFRAVVTTFAGFQVLLLGLILTVAALCGMMAATLILQKGYPKLAVGFGLVPRGEVTLIFPAWAKPQEY